jgi:pentatricopeptide repeat protein
MCAARVSLLCLGASPLWLSVVVYLQQGKSYETHELVHDRLIKAGYGLCRMPCWNAFLAMYFKCGNMEDALSVFEEMKERMYNFM